MKIRSLNGKEIYEKVMGMSPKEGDAFLERLNEDEKNDFVYHVVNDLTSLGKYVEKNF
jgi:hypothetical protein